MQALILKFWVIIILLSSPAIAARTLDDFFAEQESSNLSPAELDAGRVIVKRKKSERDLMMITKWRTKTDAEQQIAEYITAEVRGIIATTEPLVPVFYNEMPVRVNQFSEPNFDLFSRYEINYILDGSVSIFKRDSGANALSLRIVVWDVSERAKTLERTFEFEERGIQDFSKYLATVVFEHITGRYGFFYGKMLYAAKQQGKAKFKRIVLASNNNDGTVRVENISNGEQLAFGPRFCKESNEILYVMSTKRDGTGIYIVNRRAGTRKKLELGLPEEREKIIFAGDFSSDCKKIVFSMAENGGTNIYTINRETGELRKLTNNIFIDTSPKFFRDDSRIVFTSDRLGSSKIWVMNADGTGQRVLSTEPGVYFSPEVSSDGKKIIFSKNRGGLFYLGLIDADGAGEQILYSSFLIENPRWAPMGRTVVFSMKTGAGMYSRLYSFSVNSRELQELAALPGDLTEPFWVDEF